MPVHLYGQLADMRALAEIAERHGLALVEDAARRTVRDRDGLRAGTVGRAAASASTPARTSARWATRARSSPTTPALAERVRALREHGQRQKYVHEWEGYTARLDTIQAVVLLHKLPHLDAGTPSAARRPALHGGARGRRRPAAAARPRG